MLYRLVGYKKTTLLTLEEDFPEIKKWEGFIVLHEAEAVSWDGREKLQHDAFAPMKGRIFRSYAEFLKQIEKSLKKGFRKRVNNLREYKENRPARHKFTAEQTHAEYLQGFHRHLRKIESHKKMQTSLLQSVWLAKLENDLLSLKTSYPIFEFDYKTQDWIKQDEHRVILRLKKYHKEV